MIVSCEGNTYQYSKYDTKWNASKCGERPQNGNLVIANDSSLYRVLLPIKVTADQGQKITSITISFGLVNLASGDSGSHNFTVYGELFKDLDVAKKYPSGPSQGYISVTSCAMTGLLGVGGMCTLEFHDLGKFNIKSQQFYIRLRTNNNYSYAVYTYSPNAYIQKISGTATQSALGTVWIHDGNSWKKAIPWVYDGSSWKKATVWVYNSGWKNTV